MTSALTRDRSLPARPASTSTRPKSHHHQAVDESARARSSPDVRTRRARRDDRGADLPASCSACSGIQRRTSAAGSSARSSSRHVEYRDERTRSRLNFSARLRRRCSPRRAGAITSPRAPGRASRARAERRSRARAGRGPRARAATSTMLAPLLGHAGEQRGEVARPVGHAREQHEPAAGLALVPAGDRGEQARVDVAAGEHRDRRPLAARRAPARQQRGDADRARALDDELGALHQQHHRLGGLVLLHDDDVVEPAAASARASARPGRLTAMPSAIVSADATSIGAPGAARPGTARTPRPGRRSPRPRAARP